MVAQIGFRGEDFGIDAVVSRGFDVAVDVVGEKALVGGALGVGNGSGEDALVGLHGFFGVGERVGIEVLEDGVTVADPVVVELVGIGEQDEAVVLFEGEDELFAGGGFGKKDGVPDLVELGQGKREAEEGGEAIEELFSVNLPGFIGIVKAGVANARGNFGFGEAGMVAEGAVATVYVEGNQYIAHVEEEGADHNSL